MVRTTVHVIVGIVLIVAGSTLIWNDYVLGYFPIVVGLTVATRCLGPKGHKPIRPNGDAGGSSGGGSGDCGGDGGGGGD